ncbi:MAG: SDR family oxidoreductase [Acidobacteria bacterium]|nr:SDR family oxidoreductase [Acidobacteriota bacterium]
MKAEKKVVFITGCSSGIGYETARIFAENGYKVIMASRNLTPLINLKRKFEKKNSDLLPLKLDIRNKEEVFKAIEALPKEFKNIDILVNNAGVGLGLDKLHEGNTDEWEAMIDTNVKGLLFVTRAVLPEMIKRNKGHIINIGSVAGREVYPGGNVYCATKFAVRGLTKALKVDLLGTNIRVTTIDPGMVETNFSNVRFRGDKERAKKVYEGMKPLTGRDIADAVYYCATRPPHCNILEMVIMPTDQSGAVFVSRK